MFQILRVKHIVLAIFIVTGLFQLKGVTQNNKPAPPKVSNIVPKGIIIHSMAEYLNVNNDTLYAKEFLKSIKLSIHGFIQPNGTFDPMITPPQKALHAGKSTHKPYNNLNAHYLGVELLVKGVHNFDSYSKAIEHKGTYSQVQFDSCVSLCKRWMKQYNIPVERVVRHSDVSGDHVRGYGHGKTDPGSAFDWNRFIIAISE